MAAANAKVRIMGVTTLPRNLKTGWAALLVPLFLAPGCAREPEVAPLGRPPVVLLVFDALHAGRVAHLGYGRATTPELDRLAAQGVSFSHAFAPAPYTIAGIASLLTGRLPDTHGVTSQQAALADEEVTLAERLSAAGYRTVAAVGNLNGGAAFGNDQGFEEFRELYRTPGSDELRRASADLFVEFTRELLAEEGDGRPLFLYLHVLEPHAPYLMPDEYRSLWLDPDYDGPLASGETQPFVDTLSGRIEVTPRDVEAAIALYDANLRWADHHFGLLRGLLERAGLWNDALVVVTSDHGEAFWEHGRWGHNDHLYDEQLRVPLIVKLPGERGLSGVVRDDVVSTLDVAPSVCQWLDLPLSGPPMDGATLAAMVERADWRPGGRELLLRSHDEIAHLGLRTATAKTIVERRQGRVDRGEVRAVLHFELTEDPREKRDQYERYQRQADRIAARLQRWGQGAILNRSERGATLTYRELKLLEELGYVDAATEDEGDEGASE
jgi:arylsulfatase A-like enzyme